MEAWDLSFTDQDLQTIDAICESATTTTTTSSSSPPSPPINTPHVSSDHVSRLKSRRRLPDSLFVFQQQISGSSSLSPCRKRYRFQANVETRFPELAFRGQISYSRTTDEVVKAADELLYFVEAERREKESQVVLGFDIEWRPTFKRGVAPGKAAVLQICADISHCYVMHIIHSGIPQKLQCLLEDPTLLKVGVCILNDAHKVFRDYNVSVKSVEDLSNLANQRFSGAMKKWSLASLAEALVCKQLPKPDKIRRGNWEANILSKEQLQYAATDAFVSWYLYQVLKRLPEAVDNRSEETEGVEPQ